MSASFENLLGQPTAKAILLNSVKHEKVSHAYLFKGPAGVGKKTAAFAFAAYLNCQQRTEHDSCGHCPSCKKYASSSHPDYIEIQPDGVQVKIDQIRQLKKDLAFAPFEAGFRVVVISDIHTNLRRKEVANSLLKTLEEPPPKTVFILTADETAFVLSTILSRCQAVPFYPLPLDLLLNVLIEKEHDEKSAQTIAKIADGSLARALALSDSSFFELRTAIIKTVSETQANAPGMVEKIFTLADQSAKLKDELIDFLELLKFWFKDLMIILAGGPDESLVNCDMIEQTITSKQRWNLSELSDKVGLISRAQEKIQANCNKAFVCEVLYFKLLN